MNRFRLFKNVIIVFVLWIFISFYFQNRNVTTSENENLFEVALENDSEPAPNTIHFAYIAPNRTKELMYFEYLAIKSAKVYGKADKVFVHYDTHLPTGKWFIAAQKYVTEFRQSPYDLTSIYGKSVKVIEHKKDLLQMFVLRDFGGIFNDLDTITLKPVQPLLNNEISLVIEAKRTSLFLQKWIEEYKRFNDHVWQHHCSRFPAKVHKAYPNHLTVFRDYGHRMDFFERSYDFSNDYSTHLWHHVSGRPFSEAMSTELIWTLETSLFCQLRNLTADEEGAGVWTEEMSKDCAVVTLEGAESRFKGMIGFWPLNNIQQTMPKVRDLSGNRMNGILSPMLQYKAAGTEFNKDYFVFRNGDHIYLPMLPESKATSFTVTLRFQINQNVNIGRKKSTLLSILLSSNLKVNVYVNVDSIQLLLHYEGKFVGPATAAIKISDFSKWYDLTVIGNKGSFTLGIAGTDKEMSYPTEEILPASLKAIWLGRKNPAEVWVFDRESDIPDGSKIADVKLYDHPLRTSGK